MGAPSAKIDHFSRRPKTDDYSLIESRCELCGAVLVGSVSDGLPQREAEHAEQCPEKHKFPPQTH